MFYQLTDLLSLGSREAVASLLRKQAARAMSIALGASSGLCPGGMELDPPPARAGDHSPATELDHNERWSDAHIVIDEVEELQGALTDYVLALRLLEQLEEDELPEVEDEAEVCAADAS